MSKSKKASESAKIAVKVIEKDGKKIAEEVFVKKSGRLLALHTTEKDVALTDDIKIVDASAIPECVENLTLPKTLLRVNLSIRSPCNYPKCSESVFNTLKAFTIDPELEKEKAKKAKKARVSAISAQAITSLSLTDLAVKIETEPVTKPRIGTLVTAELPFDYEMRFVIPKRPKKDETERINEMLSLLRTPKDENGGIDGELDYLEMLDKAGKKFQDEMKSLKVERYRGDFPDDVLKRFIERSLSPLPCEVFVEGDTIKIKAGHFILLRVKMFGVYRSLNSDIMLGMDTEPWRKAVKAALSGKSVSEIWDVQCEKELFFGSISIFRAIDMNAWKYTPIAKERNVYDWDSLREIEGKIEGEKTADEWLDEAFSSWKWKVDIAIAKRPMRKVIRVGLPFDVAFVFNISKEPKQQLCDAKKVFAIMSVLKSLCDDEDSLFYAVRQYSVNSPLSVSDKTNMRCFLDFSGFDSVQDALNKVPHISQGKPTVEFLQKDIESFFEGTTLEYQVYVFNTMQFSGKEKLWSCHIAMKTGDKVTSLYLPMWSILEHNKNLEYPRASVRDVLKKTIDFITKLNDVKSESDVTSAVEALSTVKSGFYSAFGFSLLCASL